MLGENWAEDKDRWLHTLGNLTLTGYNSELGDKPFADKKAMMMLQASLKVSMVKSSSSRETMTVSYTMRKPRKHWRA